LWIRETYLEVAEETLKRNETMKARYKEEWGELDLAEAVGYEIPNFERHMSRHGLGQTLSEIADCQCEFA
jgi:hypothetical protein